MTTIASISNTPCQTRVTSQGYISLTVDCNPIIITNISDVGLIYPYSALGLLGYIPTTKPCSSNLCRVGDKIVFDNWDCQQSNTVAVLLFFLKPHPYPMCTIIHQLSFFSYIFDLLKVEVGKMGFTANGLKSEIMHSVFCIKQCFNLYDRRLVTVVLIYDQLLTVHI